MKKCCGPKLPRYVEKSMVDEIKKKPEETSSIFWNWMLEKGYAEPLKENVVEETSSVQVLTNDDVMELLERKEPSEQAST